jgi:hypothetical protein
MIKDTELEIEDLDKLELAVYEDEVTVYLKELKINTGKSTLTVYLMIHYGSQ